MSMKVINEQIEEMAKIIDNRLIEARGYLGSMNKGEGYWIAQKLIEHYQPKLPEGAVVLTKFEYESLRQSLVQTTNRECELADRARALLHECDVLKIDLEQAHKETAREILNTVDNESNGQTMSVMNYLRKKYGVEVEE